jgi:CheY-like chemotaxis protein
MDAETLSHIFEPFFTTKPVGKGTGLGLAAVYACIKGHGGAIDVHSQPGTGTEVIIFLPLNTEAFSEPEPALATSALHGKGHVLVVDDEVLIRNFAFQALQSLGYQVTTCCDGVEARDFYQNHADEIDLVLLDLIMPRMNGRDTFLALQKINPQVRVVLCSGFSDNGTSQGLLDLGARGFLSKPFRLEELARVVARHLAGPTPD